jgi:hypothetical protein
MIATIKAEWRKSRFRPAFLVSSGLIGAITVLVYGSGTRRRTQGPLVTR